MLWMDGVNNILDIRGLTIQKTKKEVNNNRLKAYGGGMID